MFKYIHTLTYIYIYNIYMYTHVNIYMYIYTYIHIHMSTLPPPPLAVALPILPGQEGQSLALSPGRPPATRRLLPVAQRPPTTLHPPAGQDHLLRRRGPDHRHERLPLPPHRLAPPFGPFRPLLVQARAQPLRQDEAPPLRYARNRYRRREAGRRACAAVGAAGVGSSRRHARKDRFCGCRAPDLVGFGRGGKVCL